MYLLSPPHTSPSHSCNRYLVLAAPAARTAASDYWVASFPRCQSRNSKVEVERGGLRSPWPLRPGIGLGDWNWRGYGSRLRGSLLQWKVVELAE